MAKFLYNGVKLPALPEWDKTEYPYAAILRHGGTDTQYRFICSHMAMKTNTSLSRLTHPDFESITGYAPKLYYRETKSIRTEDSSWGTLTGNGANILGGYVLWTNFDMKDNNGDLRMARTTPIPVPGLDLTALTTGWLVGRAIAGQRKKQTQVPDGVLISSDGYILTDCDGVYLIAMDEDADAVPEGALISSDGYILKDSKGRYLIARRKLDG
jgi:hypothetical protein